MSSPSDTLRSARIARGFTTAAEAARYFGWSEVTYTSHENGIRGIRKDTATKYAKAFGIDAATLLGLHTSTLQVDADQGVHIEGTAVWGVWRDKVMADGESELTIEVPRASRFSPRRAVLIGDQSVNKSIPKGAYAIYEPLDHHEIAVGKLLVIKRHRDNLTELSVRRVQSSLDGRLRLVDHSTEGQYREALTVSLDDESGLDLLGIVVGVYTPL
jgi:transcriptional regulator with XRE-family HTH domain